MMTKPSSLFSFSISLTFASLVLLLSGCGKKDAAGDAKSTSVAASSAGSGEVDFSTDEKKVSYGIGFNIGRDMAAQKGLTIDQAALAAGLVDALNQAEPQITEEDLRAAFMAVQQKVAEVMAKEGEANLAKGNAFLEANKARAGVVVTKTGLQYEVISSGDGPKPSKENTVKVHYHGTLIDGAVFDSSVQRGEPAEFPVGAVIPGWTEALQLMSVGDKWKLYVPAKLGYGAQARPTIPSQSALIFEVELLEIK